MNILLLLLCLALKIAAAAQIPDPPLFHFEAAPQPLHRQNARLPLLRNQQPVDFLINTPPGNYLPSQPLPDRRPLFISNHDAAYLLFDGKDDFLSLTTSNLTATELTIFILAAPQTNQGNFSGPLGMAALGQNDYTSGLNLDFGPQPTSDITVINVESAGASGFQDLLTPGFFNAADRPFGSFHLFTVRTRPGSPGTEFFLDGFKGGDRPRSESTIALHQLTLGARLYSNDPAHFPFAQGFFKGAIAEIIIFNRALSDNERRHIEQVLLAKTGPLNALLHGKKGHALQPIPDPPIVQMFVPGFSVHELPLQIANLNNVRYRHDGKLVAQGYDGRIYLLSDSDGDGLEDSASFFWDKQTLRSPIGIALTPKGYPKGEGVFVASKGKLSLVLDTDRDGKADEEIVIASGWPEPLHNVDLLGLVLHPEDGSIYFGRGCANFVEPYLIDRATGKSNYRLDDERGTIQRISPDFKTREIVATGLRYTCALAFNTHGELFATDQEGATWLPNGNPFDELLHIQRGKHYGFPPRHPKHLPHIVDEPAIYEYGPQHQSTVGLTFNEGVNGGPHFGPSHWQGNALLTGAARGKIYRTQLSKTPLGYVAKNHLIASLAMLAIDLCISPSGDLLIACHSGPPDWGTGPTGQGRLFKIRYSQPDLPQPVLAWAAAPDEFRIAFDRPLQTADWHRSQKEILLEAGEFVGAGDRFESLRPGYQIVRDQMAAPRRWVDLLGLNLSEDRRTLILRVPRQTELVSYALTLPLPQNWARSSGLKQYPQFDLALTLNGFVATATAGNQTLRTVLPHPSLATSEELTRGSAEHQRFIQFVRENRATLTLQGFVDTSNPFVPAVQPGSKLDWDPTQDSFAAKSFAPKTDLPAELVTPTSDHPKSTPVHLTTTNPPAGANGLFLAADDLQHPLAPSRIRLPWSSTATPLLANKNQPRTDIQGNWLKGRRLFFGSAGCATCHTIRDEGTHFGPDLSNLVFRDRESVLNDIIHPSATINPDHTGSLVKFIDGSELSGLVASSTETNIHILLPTGTRLDLHPQNVSTIEPLHHSLMPPGIDQQLTSDEMEDLLTFLLAQPLEPAPITRTDPAPPPARKISELVEVLGDNPRPPLNPSPFRILLVAGPKDHGPDEHHYPFWLDRWSHLLALAENVTVDTAPDFPTPEQLLQADVALFYNANLGWTVEKAALLDSFHKKGGGAVYLHYALHGDSDPAAVAERVGLTFTWGSRFRHGPMELIFEQKDHPITRGFSRLLLTDETYWNMRGDLSRILPLSSSIEDGSRHPQLWTLQRHKSRIVGCIPGHYTWTFDDPLYRLLVFRSICWAAGLEDLDRLAELTTIGARLEIPKQETSHREP